MLSDGERAHFDLLGRWRHAMDLVGPGPLEPHFVDARQAVGWLDATGAWADLGSGAGFPGIALALMHSGVHVDLVESRRKRATFLEQVVHATGLSNASVRHLRSEALPDHGYDGVVSRAYRQPEAYLVDACRLLRPGGVAVLLQAQEAVPFAADFEVFHVERYRVDGRPRVAVGLRKSV